MRRAHANQNQETFPLHHPGAGVEEENERMADELKDKIGLLRTLAIDMGTEVKDHNHLLGGLSDDMEHSRGFLGKTMDRVILLARGGHNYHLLYLFIFCIMIFIILWIVLKFR